MGEQLMHLVTMKLQLLFYVPLHGMLQLFHEFSLLGQAGQTKRYLCFCNTFYLLIHDWPSSLTKEVFIAAVAPWRFPEVPNSLGTKETWK